jgi:hypothetical protein
MKNFSPHEEQLIKESAEWFNKTVTKIKSRKDPYRETVMNLMDELSGLVDDIDQSLYQLSRADEETPNFEYSSSFTVSAIKDKMQAFSHRVAFLAEDLAKDESIKSFIGGDSGEPDDSKPDDDKPKGESSAEKLEEITVKEPAKPKNVEKFLSIDDMVDKLIEVMYSLEEIESNMNNVGNGILQIYKNDKKKVLTERLSELDEEVKNFLSNKNFIILKEKIENIVSRKNEIVKDKSLSESKYVNLIAKYRVIVEKERDIIYKYRTLYNFLTGIKEDQDVPPPPEPVKEEVVPQPQQQNEEENLGSEGTTSGNIIVNGTSYMNVVDSFLQKYATKPTVYQRFMTSLNTMLMQVNSAFFSNKAERILKFRESLITLKNGIVKIMGAIKSTAGTQGDPQKEIARWDSIIDEYNKFADLYNKLIHTDISSRLSSLNQDLIQERELSMSPQSMVSKNTFNTATNSAKRNYQPAKFVINKLPGMETLIKQYAESGKIWGMKGKPIE